MERVGFDPTTPVFEQSKHYLLHTAWQLRSAAIKFNQ
jgi:hypothetical protein